MARQLLFCVLICIVAFGVAEAKLNKSQKGAAAQFAHNAGTPLREGPNAKRAEADKIAEVEAQAAKIKSAAHKQLTKAKEAAEKQAKKDAKKAAHQAKLDELNAEIEAKLTAKYHRAGKQNAKAEALYAKTHPTRTSIELTEQEKEVQRRLLQEEADAKLRMLEQEILVPATPEVVDTPVQNDIILEVMETPEERATHTKKAAQQTLENMEKNVINAVDSELIKERNARIIAQVDAKDASIVADAVNAKIAKQQAKSKKNIAQAEVDLEAAETAFFAAGAKRAREAMAAHQQPRALGDFAEVAEVDAKFASTVAAAQEPRSLGQFAEVAAVDAKFHEHQVKDARRAAREARKNAKKAAKEAKKQAEKVAERAEKAAQEEADQAAKKAVDQVTPIVEVAEVEVAPVFDNSANIAELLASEDKNLQQASDKVSQKAKKSLQDAANKAAKKAKKAADKAARKAKKAAKKAAEAEALLH